MKQLKNDLLTNKYTKVYHEDEPKFNTPHHFEVTKKMIDSKGVAHETLLQRVDFQEGAIKEHGVNGVMNEDLLVMVLTRLEGFQNSDFRCRENDMAITKIEEALMWLRKRTVGRENRGVEGTHQK